MTLPLITDHPQSTAGRATSLMNVFLQAHRFSQNPQDTFLRMNLLKKLVIFTCIVHSLFSLPVLFFFALSQLYSCSSLCKYPFTLVLFLIKFQQGPPLLCFPKKSCGALFPLFITAALLRFN